MGSTYYDSGYQNSQYGGQQQYYGAPGAPQPTYGGSDYSSYQPPRDNNYNHETAVARYDEESGRRSSGGRYRSRSRSRYDDDRVYEDRRGSYDNRSRSRSRRGSASRGFDDEEGERGLFGGGDGDHHKGKDIGATLAGGAIGGFVGHEFGHNKMATTIGALAGAFAGHELEKHHEKKKLARREFESDSVQYDSYSRRSLSGSRPGSRASGSRSMREDEYSDDEYEDRRPRHHHHRDSDRYD